MPALPPAMLQLLAPFAPLFARRVWGHALVLVAGAILTPGRRTVCAALRARGLSHAPHWTRYHRVPNRAKWSSRAASRVLLGLLVAAFAPAGPHLLGLDETVERRWGPQIAATGLYRDAARSSKGYFVKVSGRRWVGLLLLVPLPWAERTRALPFLTVLAPSERHDRDRGRRHKALTDWARQTRRQVRRWLPARALVVVADSGYAAIALLARCARLARPVTVITRLRLDALRARPAAPAAPGRPPAPERPPLSSTGPGRGRAPSRSPRRPPCGTTAACRPWRFAGCRCATPPGDSPRKPCSAPTRPSRRRRPSPGSCCGGGWR